MSQRILDLHSRAIYFETIGCPALAEFCRKLIQQEMAIETLH